MKGAEPALNVGGVPAGDQAAVLEGPQLQGRVRPSRDHLVEGVLQGHWVIVGSLVLQARGQGQWAQRKRLSSAAVKWPKPWLQPAAVGSSPGSASHCSLTLGSHGLSEP